MVIKHGAADRIKPRLGEGSVLFLSGGKFEGTYDGELEGVRNGEFDNMGNSERTGVGNKLGISDGEVMGITLGDVGRSKLGGDEESGPVLLCEYFEGTRDDNLEYGSEELEESSIRYSME